MNFLVSHWHCIFPLIVLIIGVMVMNKKDKKNTSKSNSGDANVKKF